MKVLVCGSRDWKDGAAVRARLADLPDGSRVIHGGAQGADLLAYQACVALGLANTHFIPDYKAHGKAAPHVRNDRMLDLAELVIAFWDGESRGTASVIKKARKRGIPVEVVTA